MRPGDYPPTREAPVLLLSRRALLRNVAVAGALAGLGGLIAACQPSAPAAAPTAAPPTAAPAASKPAGTTAPASAAPTSAPAAPPAAAKDSPRRGGSLTWALWDRTDDIDPATTSGAAALEVLTNILEPLITIDADLKIYPALAKAWTMDGGGERFTFTLRDDVKFHDGAVFDSAAVKRTWERILDPATKAAGNVGLLGPIDRLEAPDPRTFVVTYKEPYPTLPLQIWRPYFGVLSPKYLDTLKPGDKASTPVGSGPFKFAGRSPDGVITLDANSDYAWGPETVANRGAPYLQQVKFRPVTDPSTRVATLESGESLLIDEIAEADYQRLKSDRRFRFVEAPRRSHTFGFVFNVTAGPTSDKAVREAVNYAVDRKSIVEKLFFGIHKVTIGPLSEGVWGRLEELERLYPYDVKKAQDTLDAAGWTVGAGGIREKAGQKLTLLLATFRSPWTEMAEAMQGQLRGVGIDLQVQKMERGPYLDFIRAYKHGLAASSSTSIDPDGILRTVYHTENRPASNFSGLSEPQLDTLLVRGAQQPIGSAERRGIYEDAQRRLMESLPYVGVFSQVRVEAMAAKVQGLRMGPDGLNALPLTDVWLEA